MTAYEGVLAEVNWIGTPGKHQLRGVEQALIKNEYALFWEPGAGKTYAVVHVAKTRYRRGEIDLLIVICPNAIRQVWPREFGKWASDTPHHFQMLEAGGKLVNPKKQGLEVLVVAVESLSAGHAHNKIREYMKGRKVMTVMDESSRIKNPGSTRTKLATAIAWESWYRMILTGTPILQGPHDLFAQIRFLNPNIIGITKWAAFKARYCVMGGFQMRNIVSHVNVEELVEKIAPYADLVRLKDCADIPEKIYQKVVVPLSPEQRDAIRQLKREGTLVIEELGAELYVEMALERMTRIQQIVGGSLPMMDPDRPGKYKCIDMPGKIPKLDALMDTIEDLPDDAKALIWARFAPERDRIQRALIDKYGEDSVVRYDGSVTDLADRKAAEDRLQTDPKCRFFLGNQSVGGIGLTLTRAVYALNYSNTFSAEDRIQMENRNHRTGQTEHCVYIDFEAMVKEDRMITKALELKQDLSEFVKNSMEKVNGSDDMDDYE